MSLSMIAFSSFVIALSGALVPGPLFTLTIAETLKRGFRAGPLIILGHGLLEMALICLLLFGAAPFLSDGAGRTAIRLLGGIVLILLGLLSLRDARGPVLDLSPSGQTRGMNLVAAGILGSLSNPYWTIWWATIGLGYLLSAQQHGLTGILVFFCGHISADLGWYSLLSFSVSRGRALVGEKGHRFLLEGCGLFLMVFGAAFVTGFFG